MRFWPSLIPNDRSRLVPGVGDLGGKGGMWMRLGVTEREDAGGAAGGERRGLVAAGGWTLEMILSNMRRTTVRFPQKFSAIW